MPNFKRSFGKGAQIAGLATVAGVFTYTAAAGMHEIFIDNPAVEYEGDKSLVYSGERFDVSCDGPLSLERLTSSKNAAKILIRDNVEVDYNIPPIDTLQGAEMLPDSTEDLAYFMVERALDDYNDYTPNEVYTPGDDYTLPATCEVNHVAEE